MKLAEFILLPREAQQQHIFSQGIFLVCTYGDPHTRCLYWVGTFFAEVVLDEESNRVVSVAAFFRSGCLKSYLTAISLDMLWR